MIKSVILTMTDNDDTTKLASKSLDISIVGLGGRFDECDDEDDGDYDNDDNNGRPRWLSGGVLRRGR